jgi:putative ATPase
MSAARNLVQEGATPMVPAHLRSTGYGGAAKLGHGEGYLYPHDHPGAVVAQQYFPDGVQPLVIYRPGDQGDEVEVMGRLEEIDRALRRDGRA